MLEGNKQFSSRYTLLLIIRARKLTKIKLYTLLADFLLSIFSRFSYERTRQVANKIKVNFFMLRRIHILTPEYMYSTFSLRGIEASGEF